MKTIVDKSALVLDRDGSYEYKIEAVEKLSFHVANNIQAELILYLESSLDFDCLIELDKGSKLNVLIMNECAKSDMRLTVHQKSDSLFNIGLYELNENESTVELKAHLDEAGATANIIKSAISSGKKRYDIECIHHAPNTSSDMKNFEISKEHADYKLRACGTIEKGAYQSKSHQMSRILTASENQRSEAIPILLIDENDVAASHANSMGKMDDGYLYYLLSRGIEEEQARELLTLSYLMPITEVITDENIQKMLIDKIRSRAGL